MKFLTNISGVFDFFPDFGYLLSDDFDTTEPMTFHINIVEHNFDLRFEFLNYFNIYLIGIGLNQ